MKRPRLDPRLMTRGALLVTVLGVVLIVTLVAACGGSEDTGVTLAPPSAPVVEGNDGGDADVYVVYVRVNGIAERVPCVLYNGYQSVAISCLDPRVP